jgi:hypothetical protein
MESSTTSLPPAAHGAAPDPASVAASASFEQLQVRAPAERTNARGAAAQHPLTAPSAPPPSSLQSQLARATAAPATAASIRDGWLQVLRVARVRCVGGHVGIRVARAPRTHPSRPPAHTLTRIVHACPQADELRAALERERAAFDAALAQRDTTLAALTEALGDADALHARAAGDHLTDVAGLEAVQAARLAALERDFASALARVQAAFAADAAAVDARHGATVLQLQHLLAAVAADEAAKAAAGAAEHEQAREAHKRRTLERIHVLQSDMDGAVEALEAAFEAAHLAYLHGTDSRTQDFKALSERGQADAAATEAQQRALRRLTRLLGAWRGKLAAAVREGDGRNGALATERDALAAQLEALKGGMGRARAATAGRLSGLCVQAQAANVVTARTAGDTCPQQ